ncbi:MAG: hypothetical protein EA365_08890 [Gloeocapsa sp. DLM2.Bin57]|nr:MAG: hypothetical protein EA365_08890 [Gloeocapsa sp. DLM2.Bin57]
MSAMYGALQQEIRGFSLRAMNNHEHERLLRLSQNIHRGEYPDPTAQRDEYQFGLYYQGKKIFDFCWADHRGGSLRETQNSEQARLLFNDLKKADGILMFCDAEALVCKNNRHNQIGRMISLVNNSVQCLNHSLTLGIVLTKTDLVPNLNKQHLQPFQSLLQGISANKSMTGKIIPVACGVKNINVELPVLYALQIGISNYLSGLYKEMSEHQKKAQKYQQKSESFKGFLKEIWQTLNEEPTYSELASDSYLKSRQTYQKIQPIIEPVKTLETYINNASTLLNSLNN